MTPEKLQLLRQQGYNRVPLMQTVLSDFETPLSVYHKLSNAPYSYLLESVQGGNKWGRYSIIGLPCPKRIEVRGNQIKICQTNGSTNKVLEQLSVQDPLEWIQDFQKSYKVLDMPESPAFTGGLVGYFGYESIRYIEPKLKNSLPKTDKINTPNIILMVSEELVVFDNLSGQVHVIVHINTAQKNSLETAQQRLNDLVKSLSKPLNIPDTTLQKEYLGEMHFESSFGESKFKKSVNKIKEYIASGDAMQIVISQQLSAPYEGSSMDLYRALRYLNPSPYMYFMDMGDFQIVGSSPEILVRLENDVVTVRPIAGTRKRGITPEQDLQLEKELLNDPKELAEHLMLIDLGRNDVGRIAKVGSVDLTEKMLVERYSHVMHIVSNVNGTIKPNMSAMDVLRATFPAGTVSGAPKVRAMEIIDELEPVKRGIYAGAIGYIGWQGNMDTAIAIRTAVVKDGRIYVQAGAGIVADSVPQSEWDETLNKGRAIFKAAEFVSEGLQATNPKKSHK